MIYIFLVLFWSTQTLANVDTVQFEMTWEYSNFPFKMKLYEIDPVIPLWQMGSEKKLPIFIKSEIKNSTVSIKKGERKKFALVFFNNHNERKYFFAAPHEINPPELSLGFKYNCLCMNHAFRAEPQSFWFRVVELRLGRDYPHSKKIKVTHTMAGLEESEGKKFLDSNIRP